MPARSRPECATCGEPFEAKDRGRPRKYCSDECRRAAGIVAAEEVADIDEVLRLLSAKARQGSVTAMSTLLRHHTTHRDDDEDEEPESKLEALDGGNVTPIRRGA